MLPYMERNGKFRVKRKTGRKKYAKKCKEADQEIKEMRNGRVEGIVRKLNEMLVGYYHYYGITDNSKILGRFRHQVGRRLYYWLNRRSQRRSYMLEGFRVSALQRAECGKAARSCSVRDMPCKGHIYWTNSDFLWVLALLR